MTSKTAAAAGSAIDRRSGEAGKPRARAKPGKRGKPSWAGLSARAGRGRDVRCGYVDVDGGQLHYREVAGSAPAIVFLHQTASASSSFQRVMQRLRLPNRLIALDTPGFGGSFAPRGWPSMTDYARWAIEALDALRVGRFHVFGQHTGANIAGELAVRHAARVRSVTMLGPVPMSAAERREFRKLLAEPIRPRPDGGHLLENWGYAAQYNPGCDLEVMHDEVVSMLRAWRGRPQAYRAVSFNDSLAVLRRIRAPVLLMTSPGDYFFPRFLEVCAVRPDAAVATVGGDNFQALLDPDGVARALERFLGES
jgi:pimeloyl-ACP methyl ester carboxylesterase